MQAHDPHPQNRSSVNDPILGGKSEDESGIGRTRHELSMAQEKNDQKLGHTSVLPELCLQLIKILPKGIGWPVTLLFLLAGLSALVIKFVGIPQNRTLLIVFEVLAFAALCDCILITIYLAIVICKALIKILRSGRDPRGKI